MDGRKGAVFCRRIRPFVSFLCKGVVVVVEVVRGNLPSLALEQHKQQLLQKKRRERKTEGGGGDGEDQERKQAAEEHNKGFETCVSGLPPLYTHI